MIPVGILTAAATSSFIFLLDQYPGAAAAYSMRKLRSAYIGPAIRVRRDSDNTQIDINFVANVLDTTTLLTFVGVGNGFITKWYDQSGNSNDAVQGTNSSQPGIVNLGVLLTENTKPTIGVVGTSLPFTTNISADTNISIFAAQRTKTTTSVGSVLGHNDPGGSGPFFGIYNNFYNLNISLNGQFKFGNSSTIVGTLFNVLNTIVNSTNVFNYVNDVAVTVPLSNGSAPSFFSQIGKYFTFSGN